MITSKAPTRPVRAVLRHHMVVDGKQQPKGAIVDLKANDFRYLEEFERVAEATPENVSAVKAEIEAEKKATAAQERHVDEMTELKLKLANALAELETVKKGK